MDGRARNRTRPMDFPSHDEIRGNLFTEDCDTRCVVHDVLMMGVSFLSDRPTLDHKLALPDETRKIGSPAVSPLKTLNIGKYQKL